MKKITCQKLLAVSISLVMGLSSVTGFAQTNQDPRSAAPSFHGSSPGVKGFDKPVFDYHFSRADREMNPDRWISEARRGAALALNAWELFASDLYDSPLLLESAKKQVEEWSTDELEERFTRWLTGRFFGRAAEKAITEISSSLDESHLRYTWHHDSEGNVAYNDITGDPQVIRPGERDFYLDLPFWRDDAAQKINAAAASFGDTITRMYPELLAYIPVEMRDSLGGRIAFTVSSFSQTLQKEFENIAAREERVFTSRRTGDVWSLRKKSDDEAAFSITAQLIGEVESICAKGIAGLATRIEEASAGSGDLALMGKEWLDMYREQFDRGIKAWEQAEERFFIRRIEWEQETVRLFNTGEETWVAAFNQFENERKNWELKTKALFESGESLFKNASDNLEKAIAGAKIEFERDFQIRAEAGTVRAQALVDMYLTACTGAAAAKDNILFWLKQYDSENRIDPAASYFGAWLEKEIKESEEDDYSDAAGTLEEIKKSYQLYTGYLKKAKESREKIISDYNVLIGGGRLKDVLSDGVSSEDFSLDEYQVALIRAKASVQYWERQTAIAEAVSSYAQDLSAGRMTGAESIRAWESSKAAYNESITRYEKELETLSARGASLQEKQAALNVLAAEMAGAESVLNSLNLEYSNLIAVNAVNRENYVLVEFNFKYDELLEQYRLLNRTGNDPAYKNLIEYALELGAARQKETTAAVTGYLTDGGGENMKSLAELREIAVPGSDAEIDLRARISGIDLFSAESGVIWYCRAWGINPAECEEASLTGRKLKERLIADVENTRQAGDNAGYRFSAGLLELYENFSGAAPFVIKEAWQDTQYDLGLLYAGYGLGSQNSLLPDADKLCGVLLRQPGDFSLNAARFLSDFDKCFSLVPEWIESEINNWKNTLCEYIALNALYLRKTPDKNMAALLADQESIEIRYMNLGNYYNSADLDDAETLHEINELYAEIYEDEIILSYRSMVTGIWEQTSKQALDAERGKTKHWRQYLSGGYIDAAKQKSQPAGAAIRAASSWKEGIMLDALDNAVFNTRRINAAFSMYETQDWKMESRESEFLLNACENEDSKIKKQRNAIAYMQEDLARLGRGYEYARMDPDVLRRELDRQYSALKSQEVAYNTLRNRYLRDAELFAAAGNFYDEQYTRVKKAFENTEAKRFEYEAQDAIRRWASTAYMEFESNDLDICRNHLLKAQTVLAVLSNLYSNEELRPYENSAYEAAYSEYERSFKNTLVSFKAFNVLNAAIIEETTNNNNIFSEYQRQLYMLGNAPKYESGYLSPADKSKWTIKDVINLKNGMLAFSKNGDMELDGIDRSDAYLLRDYFTANKTFPSGRHKVSQFEIALLGLNQRMKNYFKDSNKFSQWGFARDYLVRTLIESNGDIEFLQYEYENAGPLASGGSLENAPYKSGLFAPIEHIGGYVSDRQNDFRNIQQRAWEELSAAEKADLEFYVILSLYGNSNGYSYGFSQYTACITYQFAYDKVKHYYDKANDKVRNLFLIGLLWTEMRDVNKATSDRLEPPLNQTREYIGEWEEELNANIKKVSGYSSAYISSSNRLSILEGIAAPGQKIKWDDIRRVLTTAGGISAEELNIVKNCWEAKFPDGGGSYASVIEGLKDMALWTVNEREKNKKALDNQWYLDNQIRQKMENDFLETVEAYMAGETGVEALAGAANAAFGRNTAAWKKHYTNIEKALVRDLELFPAYGFDYLGNFSDLGNEYISLAVKTFNNRYYAELALREAEWNEQRLDLANKYLEWRETAEVLTEKGRQDWKAGAKKLELNYKQWNANFLEEQRRISGAWAGAYLAGLEDKEEWLEQAAAAADQASSDALLRAVGAEAERLARFVDTREPLGIRGALPETEKMLAELLNKPGLGNIETVFGVMGNISNLGASAVRRGASASGAWDANIVKAAAADMARKTNAEISDREARRLAYSARETVMEALKSLSANVDAANSSFRENMDRMFIVQGQWRKNGTRYIKDIIVGSTFTQPLITDEEKVDGYYDYQMSPIALKTNIDEERLSELNSFAVRGLIENVYAEIEMLMAEIFGDGSKQEIQSGEGERIRYLVSGKFGAHIGYEPFFNPSGGTSRDSMFFDRGSGETGRLMTEFYYWSVIDGQGLAKLNVAIWDKPLWDDRGSSFTAPSLRSATEFVGQVGAGIIGLVAAPVTGGASVLGVAALMAGINTVDDLAFNALDVAYGYKTIDEAGFAFGKALLANSVGSFASAGFNGMAGVEKGFFAAGNGLTGAAVTAAGSGPISTVITQTAMAGVQAFTTGTVTSAINGITYSHENGWGYSTEIFREGMKGTMISALSSATSAFTTGTLTGINNTEDMRKFQGISIENYTNTAQFNGVLGSLAGQGVEYAMGNDFTLNLFNPGFLTGGIIDSGILELHLGRDGSSQMNFGAGGADVSPDTIVRAVMGAYVWNLKNRVAKYIKNNEFKEAAVLLGLYGYGDDQAQKKLLKDILSGEVEIILVDGVKYEGLTDRKDGKRVIYLPNQSGMSNEEQARLSAILGYEAYRDGYHTNDINELRDAAISGYISMGDRIDKDYEWFSDYNFDFADMRMLLNAGIITGNMEQFDAFLKNNFNNEKDHFFLETKNGGDFQNSLRYQNETLFEGRSNEEIKKLNEAGFNAAFTAYKNHLAEMEGYTGDIANFITSDGKTDADLQKELANNKVLQRTYGYDSLINETISRIGCMFMGIKYGAEAINQQKYDTLQLNQYIKEKGLFTQQVMLSKKLMADTMTLLSEGRFTVTLIPECEPDKVELPSVERLWELEQSNEIYLAHIRVKDPETGDLHSQMLKNIVFDFSPIYKNGVGIKEINTTNPLDAPDRFSGKTSFDSMAYFDRMDIFHIKQNTLVTRPLPGKYQAANSKTGMTKIWPYTKK